MRLHNIEIEKIDDEDAVHVEIEHPRNNDVSTIEIGLADVRAADNIRIKYDFDRDGWVILQPRGYHPQTGMNEFDYEEEWIESAFCPAWRFALEQEEKFKYKPK